MTMSSEGGCLCGKLRYRLGGSVRNSRICYCIDCRSASGAPGVAWVSVGKVDFLVLSGELKQVRHADRLRSFAACCGTPILIQDAEDSEWVDVTTSSLDSPEVHSPQAAIWTEDRLSWVPSLGSLVEFGRDREKP